MHMTASGYKVVATAVIEMLDEMDKSHSTDSVAGAAGGSRTERTWGDDAAALRAPERNRGARGARRSWRGNKATRDVLPQQRTRDQCRSACACWIQRPERIQRPAQVEAVQKEPLLYEIEAGLL
jgi:hypothetical protein